ncbi:MAG: DnaD domain protein [Clostridia bacterium]|nr:DnaD domain protein [Clostridia bacterium]
MGIINFSNRSNTTMVSNDFITNSMPNLSGDFVKIYLYMLMLSSHNEDISIDEVASFFGIFSSEIIKALELFNSMGLCKFTKYGDNYDLSFDTTLVSRPISEASSNVVSNVFEAYKSESVPLGMDFEKQSNMTINDINKKNEAINEVFNNQVSLDIDSDTYNAKSASSYDSVLSFTNNVNNNGYKDTSYKVQDKYSIEELSFLVQNNSDVSELKLYIEKTYGQTLTTNLLEQLVSIVCSEYVSTTSLKNIVSYIHENNAKITKLAPLLSALEQKAIELNDKGIVNDNDVVNYLANNSDSYRDIAKRFGIYRSIAPSEKVYIDKWLYEMKMPKELVMKACDKTIGAIGKPSFQYADRIITEWKRSNVTLDNADQKKPKTSNANGTSVPKKSGFNNYTVSGGLSEFEMNNLTKLVAKNSKYLD